jgi:hypothetical protein
MSQWCLTCSASWLTWMNAAKFWRHQIPFSVLYVQARSQVSWWSRTWTKQQQLVRPGGVLIPAKHVLSWSQNGMRIKHVLMLHKCSPLLTPKMWLPLLLFNVLWQVVFSIQIFTNSQDSGILIQLACFQDLAQTVARSSERLPSRTLLHLAPL